MNGAHEEGSDKPWEIQVAASLGKFLESEEYRFHFLTDTCIELFIQGKHLTMRFLVYAHNRHVVVRVPAFIRNIELRRTDVLLAIMALMNDFFDIRFELAEHGQSLSASCNHILEDGVLTQKQFSQMMMVTAYLVDEAYPRLMQVIFGGTATADTQPLAGRPRTTDFELLNDDSEEDAPESSLETEGPEISADSTDAEDSEDYDPAEIIKREGPKIN